MKPEQRAENYRARAAEIRTLSKFAMDEDARASFLSLAVAFERLADAAEFDLIEHLAATQH